MFQTKITSKSLINYKSVLLSSAFSFVLSLVLFTTAFAATLKTSISTDATDLKTDDVFVVNLKINPELGYPVYTVGATLKYDPEFFTYIDATLYDPWFSLSKTPYKLLDTKNGIITLTGGYPEGMDLTNKFIGYTFKVKKVGSTNLSIIDGFAYDNETIKSPIQKSVLKIQTSQSIVVPNAPVPQTPELAINTESQIYQNQDFNFSVIHPKVTLASSSVTGRVVIKNTEDKTIFLQDLNINTVEESSLNIFVPKNTLKPDDYKILFTVDYAGQIPNLSTEKNLTVLKQSFFEKYIWPINLTYISIILLLLLLLLSGLTAHRHYKKRKMAKKKVLKVSRASKTVKLAKK